MSNITLFCLSFAGGSAYIYKQWKQFLDSDIEIFPLELPGHGVRFNERCFEDLNEMVDDAYKQITKELNGQRYAIMGYSMGAIIAFEVVRKLQENGYYLPGHVFFCAQNSPSAQIKRNMRGLSEDEFFQKVLELGGTEEELVNNKEIRKIFGKILRSDYEAFETYEFHAGTKIKCDCSVLFGNRDQIINHIYSWNEVLERDANYYSIEGNHFFIKAFPGKVFHIINQVLKQCFC